MKNIAEKFSRGGANAPVYTVNNTSPDENGNVKTDTSFLATKAETLTLKESLGLGTDIHGVTESGIYPVGNQDMLTNAPNGSRCGVLLVINVGMVFHTWIDSGGTVSVETFSGSPAVWSAWENLPREGKGVIHFMGTVASGTDLHSISDPGVYSIRGATDLLNVPPLTDAGKSTYWAQLTVQNGGGFLSHQWINSNGLISVETYSGLPATWSAWKTVTTS